MWNFDPPCRKPPGLNRRYLNLGPKEAAMPGSRARTSANGDTPKYFGIQGKPCCDFGFFGRRRSCLCMGINSDFATIKITRVFYLTLLWGNLLCCRALVGAHCQGRPRRGSHSAHNFWPFSVENLHASFLSGDSMRRYRSRRAARMGSEYAFPLLTAVGPLIALLRTSTACGQLTSANPIPSRFFTRTISVCSYVPNRIQRYAC